MRLLHIGPRTPRSECVLHPDRFIMPAACLRSSPDRSFTKRRSATRRLVASRLRSIPGGISLLGKLRSSHRVVLWLITNPDVHPTQLLPSPSIPNDVTLGRAASFRADDSSADCGCLRQRSTRRGNEWQRRIGYTKQDCFRRTKRMSSATWKRINEEVNRHSHRNGHKKSKKEERT